MTTKSTLEKSEWDLLKSSPQWIEAMLTSHRAGGGGLVGKRYQHILDKVLSNHKTSNRLVQEVLDFNEDPKIDAATTQDQAKRQLEKIGQLLEQQVDDSDAKAFRQFLLDIAQSFAKETSEGLFGLGKDVSKKEIEILETIKVALKATDADAQRRAKADRQEAKAKAEAAEAAQKKREAEAEARAKAAEEARQKREAEAEAKAKAKAAEEERKKREAEARAKAKAAEAARKKQEAEQKAKAAPAAAKAEPAKAEQKPATAAPAAQPAAAHQKAEAAPRIYEVKPGDSLSKIALEIYGNAARWPEIFEANKDQIKDPNLIHPGQKFRIP